MKNNFTKKIISKLILNNLYKINDVQSVTITGSFNEKIDIKKIGDIDVIVVFNELTKKKFAECKKEILKLNKFIQNNTGRKLKINSIFGPLKYDISKLFVIHLMIYDMSSHIHHTIKSPFTCYDWERSNNYVGKSLKEISPVLCLLKRDFFTSRRSSPDYINDLSKSKISYREYNFKNEKIILKKKSYKLDEKNKIEFSYHIVKNLIINLYKYFNNINRIPDRKNIKKIFLKITNNNNKLFNEFIFIDSLKKKQNYKDFNFNAIKFSKVFLKYYDNFLRKIFKENKKFIFIRHQKTIFNNGTFFGQNRDANILNRNKIKDISKIDFDLCFTSQSKRSYETGLLYVNKKDIIKNKYLNEINYGKAEGLNYSKLKKKYPNIIYDWSKKLDPLFPGGENTEQVKKRLFYFINNHLKKLRYSRNNNILIITHNVVLKCLLGKYFNIKKILWYKINISFLNAFEFYFYKNELRLNCDRKIINRILKKLNYKL